jgi:hypothetical protein
LAAWCTKSLTRGGAKELDIDGKIVLDWREDGLIHEVKLTDKMENAHENL